MLATAAVVGRALVATLSSIASNQVGSPRDGREGVPPEQLRPNLHTQESFLIPNTVATPLPSPAPLYNQSSQESSSADHQIVAEVATQNSTMNLVLPSGEEQRLLEWIFQELNFKPIAGCDVNTWINAEGLTLLVLADNTNHADIIMHLITLGLDLETVRAFGEDHNPELVRLVDETLSQRNNTVLHTVTDESLNQMDSLSSPTLSDELVRDLDYLFKDLHKKVENYLNCEHARKGHFIVLRKGEVDKGKNPAIKWLVESLKDLLSKLPNNSMYSWGASLGQLGQILRQKAFQEGLSNPQIESMMDYLSKILLGDIKQDGTTVTPSVLVSNEIKKDLNLEAIGLVIYIL